MDQESFDECVERLKETVEAVQRIFASLGDVDSREVQNVRECLTAIHRRAAGKRGPGE